ncbi:hypothetical protein CEXT_133691 [Caerostris extrusa]|uniref:Uncharacterized protein n=1 Tax=Caerostris extrusa TaxID=172846 RepID=A0AAV4SE92_CAEEX|nr:hypothetical protein CEXT_133691 [Caerostris extrusa]
MHKRMLVIDEQLENCYRRKRPPRRGTRFVSNTFSRGIFLLKLTYEIPVSLQEELLWQQNAFEMHLVTLRCAIKCSVNVMRVSGKNFDHLM